MSSSQLCVCVWYWVNGCKSIHEIANQLCPSLRIKMTVRLNWYCGRGWVAFTDLHPATNTDNLNVSLQFECKQKRCSFSDQFVLTIELEINVIKYDCCIEYFGNNKLTESDEYAWKPNWNDLCQCHRIHVCYQNQCFIFDFGLPRCETLNLNLKKYLIKHTLKYWNIFNVTVLVFRLQFQRRTYEIIDKIWHTKHILFVDSKFFISCFFFLRSPLEFQLGSQLTLFVYASLIFRSRTELDTPMCEWLPAFF